jgi:cold-inducible RNA-binding protein
MASKLYVGNLPFSATDGSLSDFVTNAGFSVASAIVIRDKMTGDPRGFGFVELADGEDVQRAIGVLNGQKLEGRTLTVNEARPPARTGFSGGRGGGGGYGGRGGGGEGRGDRGDRGGERGGGGGYGRRRDY